MCCQLPLLGNLSKCNLKEMILRAISDEATTVEFYNRLLCFAPCCFDKDFIRHARDDEIVHLNCFKKLYHCCFGCLPDYCVRRISYSCFKEGLMIALKGELLTTEFYRDIQLSVTDKLVRDTFYYAMVDEIRHGTMFSTLLNQC